MIRFFRWLFYRKCNHMFLMRDVMDLSLDPKCEFCGKKLSECKAESTRIYSNP